jgi:hypothetical protein
MKQGQNPPFYRWQYVISLCGLIVATLAASGIWYNSLRVAATDEISRAADNAADFIKPTGKATQLENSSRVECSVFANNVINNESININVGDSICAN